MTTLLRHQDDSPYPDTLPSAPLCPIHSIPRAMPDSLGALSANCKSAHPFPQFPAANNNNNNNNNQSLITAVYK